MPDVHVLALDPSFRNTGWAVVRLEPEQEVVLAVGCISTKKANKKQKAFAGDDNHRCAQEIARVLGRLLEEWMPEIVCAEAQAGSKSSKAAMLMGMGWGIISALTEVREVPVLQVTPVAIKEANTGSKKASKDEIEQAVRQRYPEVEALLETAGVKPAQCEHVWDALSAAIACFDSNEVRTLRRLAGE